MAWKKIHLEDGVSTTIVLTSPGTLVASTDVSMMVLAPCALTINNVRCFAKTAPSGGSVLVDINKEGTTVFTTQANRPAIPGGANKGAASATPDVTALIEGDRVTLDIDTIGTTVAGASLSVEVRCLQ